jgi:hypothetical protein
MAKESLESEYRWSLTYLIQLLTFSLYFLGVLGFELRALHLLGRSTIT